MNVAESVHLNEQPGWDATILIVHSMCMWTHAIMIIFDFCLLSLTIVNACLARLTTMGFSLSPHMAMEVPCCSEPHHTHHRPHVWTAD